MSLKLNFMKNSLSLTPHKKASGNIRIFFVIKGGELPCLTHTLRNVSPKICLPNNDLFSVPLVSYELCDPYEIKSVSVIGL